MADNQKASEELLADIEKFLASGGTIQRVNGVKECAVKRKACGSSLEETAEVRSEEPFVKEESFGDDLWAL